MKIHSLSKIIAFPFIIGIGVVLYFLFMEDKESWYPYLFPFGIALAIIYAFHPKIDFWWHQKHPPDLGTMIKRLVYNASDFFKELDEPGRKKFLDRMSIFIHAKAFHLMMKEKVDMPVDMQALYAINAITITYHLEDYLYGHYDYYIAYMHPFPSPTRKYLHAVETYHEDGVIICNANTLFEIMVEKSERFNLGLFAFAEAFVQLNNQTEFPEFDEAYKEKIALVLNIPYDQIIVEIGYEPSFPEAILIALYFQNPKSFTKVFPEIVKAYADIFG